MHSKRVSNLPAFLLQPTNDFLFHPAKTIANYTLPLHFKDAFETVALNHNINILLVFLVGGKLVLPSQLAVRLPYVLVKERQHFWRPS